MRYVIGVDEAGRGPLAGPISVGAVLAPENFDWHEGYALVTRRGTPALRDSKKLSAQQRETLFDYIEHHGMLRHAVAFVDAASIDAIGIANAAHEAAAVALSQLGVAPGHADVLLDAGLRAPPGWNQRSIIRGDETVPAIALASVVAKVARDRLMEEAAARYPAWGFEEHKGYGTLAHRQAIARLGLSEIHRVSFCTRLHIGPKAA